MPLAKPIGQPHRSIPMWAEAGSASSTVGRADDQAEQKADQLARKALTKSGQTPALPSAEPALRPGQSPPPALAGEGGRPLPDAVRATMGARFGVDLARVRVHTEPAAEAAVEQFGALAVTSGADIAFGPGRYAPGSAAGDALLAHELAHVALVGTGHDTPGGPLRRQPNPAAPQNLKDPISGSELADYGFWAVGPDFTAAPTVDADIRQVLIENNLADAETLGDCQVQQFQTSVGPYFAYIHPTLGIVARAGGWPMGYAPQARKVGAPASWSVFVYARNDVGLTLRPLGGTGQTRAPSQTTGPMSNLALATGADLQAALRLIEARLAGLAKRYPPGDAALGAPIAKAQADAAALRADVVAGSAPTTVIETATAILEAADYDLSLIDQQAAKLAVQNAPRDSVDALRRRYGTVLGHLLQPDARDTYNEAQRWAERLPEDILLDALRAHGSLNMGVLGPSATLVAWVDNLRARLDGLYTQRQQLAAKPDDPALTKSIEDEAAFLEAAVRGIQLWAQYLVVFENFLRNRPGILDTPLIDALHRVRERLDAMKAAYDAHDTATLKARVDALEADKAVQDFYRALPAAMQVTRLIAKIGITTLAAMASGGIGGLVSGGARTAVTGITFRGALTFAGTAVLEAVTFTAITATAGKFLFGEKVTFGSALKDFAWNLGLFLVLRGMSGVSEAVLRAAELEVLTSPVQLTAGFALAHGWGVLQFRIQNDRWPSKAELDQMTAESVLMMAGIVLGSAVTQRWLQSRQSFTGLKLLQREYGWRYAAVDSLRSQLASRVKAAEAAGKGSDPAELAAARTDAQTLEKSIQDLLQTIIKDKRFTIAQIREQLNSLRTAAPELAAAILAEVLAIPADVGLRRTGSASYTYANAKTGTLEEALNGSGYRVDKAMDPVSGVRTLRATKAGAPELYFEERAVGGLDFDPGLFDVRKLMAEFSLTDHRAQRMLLRLLAENGMMRNAQAATSATRRQVSDLVSKNGKSAEASLVDLYQTGRLRSTAPAQLVATADRLAASGILTSSEWLEARSEDNRRGVVGEWLAREAVPPAAGTRVFGRVTVQADLFDDVAATMPAKDVKGIPRGNVTVVETDLVYGHDAGANVAVDTVINVKASGERGMARSSSQQNKNFNAVLMAKPGAVVELQLAEGTRYARVKSISALEGGQPVDLTGKLTPSPFLAAETVGPRGAGGFTKSLAENPRTISGISALLYEKQLIQSGEY